MWVPQKEYAAAGAVLAALRDRAGLTQQELAKLLRKPQSFVSSYERGQRRVDVLELRKIAEALDCDALEIAALVLGRDRAKLQRRLGTRRS